MLPRQTIFLLLSIAAVLTNAGLIAFTMDVLDPYSESVRFWVFIGFQWICFSLQVARKHSYLLEYPPTYLSQS